MNSKTKLHKRPYSVDPSAWRQDVTLPSKLGCMGCPDFTRCGGLRIEGPALDCTTFCDCKSPRLCDRACRMNPYFVARVQEVGSLDLCRLPEATNTTTPRIAGYAPFIYHGSKRATACDSPIIAMPFFALFNRITGEPRFTDRGHLAETFKISRDSILIASATEKDGPLERWWKLDAGKKQLVYENLRRLDIDLVTGPNYSVFNNVPFWNNWYNQKRSALSWCEFMSEGVPCALHLNAHKKEDYEEFLRLLVARPDVTTLSVEFKTGMGHASRIQWHSAQLCRLALRTGRPLHLVMRGGKAIVHDIYNSFSTVLFIDTEPFVKTQQRQKAFEGNDQRLSWRPEATGLGETLDARLQESIELSQKNFETLRAKQPDQAKLIGRLTNYRGQKSPDMSERRQLSLFSPTVQAKRIVAAPKSQ